jgi:hypothetical protein
MRVVEARMDVRFLSLLLLFLFVETLSHHVVQAGLQITILPPPHPLCWDYWLVTPKPAQISNERNWDKQCVISKENQKSALEGKRVNLGFEP